METSDAAGDARRRGEGWAVALKRPAAPDGVYCDRHGAGLLALLAFAFMQGEAHLHARLQLLELAVDDAVAVKIDPLTVGCRADEAVVGEEWATVP
jgi:hypothetical protein